MSSNPFPNERSEPIIEELQPKPRPIPQTPVSHQPAEQTASVAPQAAAHREVVAGRTREDALTIKFAIGKLNDYIQWFLMVLESILIIRFLLKMFGADPKNLFANLIFSLTEVLLVPFTGIVSSPSLRPNQAFEISTLIAALVYFLIFFALQRFLRILISSPENPVE